jgi:hypothetical protein
LGGPQAQMRYRLEHESTLDGGVRVDSRFAGSGAVGGGSPPGEGGLVESEG